MSCFTSDQQLSNDLDLAGLILDATPAALPDSPARSIWPPTAASQSHDVRPAKPGEILRQIQDAIMSASKAVPDKANENRPDFEVTLTCENG